jgi:hypothetical protein
VLEAANETPGLPTAQAILAGPENSARAKVSVVAPRNELYEKKDESIHVLPARARAPCGMI